MYSRLQIVNRFSINDSKQTKGNDINKHCYTQRKYCYRFIFPPLQNSLRYHKTPSNGSKMHIALSHRSNSCKDGNIIILTEQIPPRIDDIFSCIAFHTKLF